MKKLTRRQREFLAKLIELHRSLPEPIHYSALADHMGVGKVAAYEMLRLLEDYGYVSAEYQRPAEARGPGRPAVVFRPTSEALDALGERDQQSQVHMEWEKTKTRILEKLRLAKSEGPENALDEMVSFLADQPTPIEYVAGMVAAIMLGIQSLRESLGSNAIRDAFNSIGLPGERGLSALGGLSVGLSLVDKWNQRVSQAFLEHVKHYQTMLSELSVENRRRLSQFTQEVMKIVSG